MFSRDELINNLPELIASARHLYPDVIRYEEHRGEEFIEVHRSTKANVDGVMQFYVSSVWHWHVRDSEASEPQAVKRVIEKAEAYFLYASISPEEFYQAYDDLIAGRLPLALQGIGKVIRAMRMIDEWNDKWFVCETTGGYAAIYWETTA